VGAKIGKSPGFASVKIGIVKNAVQVAEGERSQPPQAPSYGATVGLRLAGANVSV